MEMPAKTESWPRCSFDEIHEVVVAGEPLDELRQIADAVGQGRSRDELKYLTFLLLRSDRILDARHLLQLNPDDHFARALEAGLSRHLSAKIRAFEGPRPYLLWHHTPFDCEVTKNKLDFFNRHIEEEVTRFRVRRLRIVDIGCGDGSLILALVRSILSIHERLKIDLILCDPSNSMLEMAAKKCSRLPVSNVSITELQCGVEHLDEERLFSGESSAEFSVVIAGESIHHVSEEQKIKCHKLLLAACDLLLMAELEGNHDEPASDSVDLAFSVWSFYGALVHAVDESDLLPSAKWECVDRLILTEAISIIKNSRELRGDYHRTARQWQDLFKRVSADILEFRTVCITPKYPRLILSALRGSPSNRLLFGI